jgi:hypothetical protein
MALDQLPECALRLREPTQHGEAVARPELEIRVARFEARGALERLPGLVDFAALYVPECGLDQRSDLGFIACRHRGTNCTQTP